MTKGAEGSSGIPADVMAAAREAYRRHVDAFDAYDAEGIHALAHILTEECERVCAFIESHQTIIAGGPADPILPEILQALRSGAA